MKVECVSFYVCLGVCLILSECPVYVGSVQWNLMAEKVYVSVAI